MLVLLAVLSKTFLSCVPELPFSDFMVYAVTWGITLKSTFCIGSTGVKTNKLPGDVDVAGLGTKLSGKAFYDTTSLRCLLRLQTRNSGQLENSVNKD